MLPVVKPFSDGLFDVPLVSRLEDAGIPLLNELSAAIISHQLQDLGLYEDRGLASLLTNLAEFKKEGQYLPTWKNFLLFLQSLKLNDLAEQISNYIGLRDITVSAETESKTKRSYIHAYGICHYVFTYAKHSADLSCLSPGFSIFY